MIRRPPRSSLDRSSAASDVYKRQLFAWFFWLYNTGVILTSAMLIWHGTLTVLGRESNAMIAGIAGLGHIAITAGMIVFFVALRRAVTGRTPVPVSYTHLTLPTSDLVEISVVAVSFKKQNKRGQPATDTEHIKQ